MAFALNRNGGDEKSPDKSARRGPLATLLRRKPQDASDEIVQMDLAGGLNRALRTTSTHAEAAVRVDDSPIRDALAAIEASLYSIDTIRDIIEQAYEVALSAQEVEDAGGRALLAESYDELRLAINKTIDELDPRAGALIGKNAHNLEVKLGGKAQYSVSAIRLDASAKGLNLDPPRDAFATFDEITRVLDELDTALKKADRAAAGYCRDAQFLIARMASDAA
ncbi:MAG: hypothetical protein VX640_05245 [Pseudomonadota bacterium]|nr:hypothetical protein [Pseudomonadota bacterium]